jgi:putative transposase
VTRCVATPTPGPSSPVSAGVNASTSSARCRRSAPSAIRINALAEAVDGLYKTELIRGPAQAGRPWKTVDEVELATLSWVHLHNMTRLHSFLGDVPPTEFEAAWHTTNTRATAHDVESGETDPAPTIGAARSAPTGS